MKGVLKIKKRYNIFVILLSAFFVFITNNNIVSANEELSYFDIEHTIIIDTNTTTTFDKYYNITAIEILDDVSKNTTFIMHTNNKNEYLSIYYNKINILEEPIYSIGFSTYVRKSAYSIVKLEGTYTFRFYYEPMALLPINDIKNLSYEFDENSLLFNYQLPDDDNFSHLELYQDGLLLADNITTDLFEVYNLEYDTKYNFTFYAIGKDGNKSSGISREIALPSDPNLVPSNNIFALTHSVSDTTVSFNYLLPLDNNFSHLKIYRNNELINDNYQLSEFIDTRLEPETEYNYRFVSVNKMDISNAGYAITIKTMEENDDVPPAVPTGLNTTAMNSGIVLSWNTNNESDLKGYNVYMNGVKLNSKPITNSIYNITNLENGTEYSFTVSAIDTFDNESEQSLSVLGVPDVDNLPIFKLDTQLSSIGSSVENWFSEIWLIVAFATAIPLSFVIAGRIKGLFIA